MADVPGSKRSYPVVIDLTEDGDTSNSNTPSKRPRTSPKPLKSTSPLVEAAATGQARRLQQLLQHSKRDLPEAAMAAAANGHLSCIAVIRQHFCDPDDDEMHLELEGREVLEEAVVPAATNGHLDVVEFMLSAMMDDGEVNGTAAWDAFHAAVDSGHTDIVKCTAGFLPTWEENFQEDIGRAVSKGIQGGFIDMVAFLLSWEEFQGDFGVVFEDAVMKKQHAIAERVYQIYAHLNEGENLFVEMASRGHTETVKYMFERGHNDAKLLSEAMKRATANKCTGLVNFLRGTGRVSSEMSARAF